MANNVIVPKKEADLLEKSRKILAACMTNREKWQIEEKHLRSLEKAVNEFEPLLIQSRNAETRTPALVSRKNQKKAVLQSELSKFYGYRLKPQAELISEDEWLHQLELPCSSKRQIRRAKLVPQSHAVIDITPYTKRSLAVKMRDYESGKTRPGRDIKYCAIRYAVLDQESPAPASHLELPLLHVEKGSVFHCSFESEHSGKMAWYAAAYMNSDGKFGPWSKPQGAIVP
jgi:hypothetical protein